MYETTLRLNEKLENAIEKEVKRTGRNKSDVMRLAIANEVLD